MDQFCVNCNGQAGFPHAADCPRPRYTGNPDEDSPVFRRAHRELLRDHGVESEIPEHQPHPGPSIPDWWKT